MKVAIIGAGLIGKKRAASLPKWVKLSCVCDSNQKKAQELAKEYEAKVSLSWQEVIKDPSIEALFICTPNKFSSEIGAAAILNGKHVLIEKPGALDRDDLEKVLRAYKKRKVVVQFGYNHRYHPAIMQAKKIIDSNKYGPILFIRAKYGHGGRIGYEKEWRFNKNLSGGGHLSDQGTHLIDLVNYFAGKLPLDYASIDTFFWDTKLEDSATLILKNKNITANLSTSCVEWKNVFSFEIMLKNAKLEINGLGRSYGTEKLTHYIMSPKMGPPKMREWLYDKEDLSWREENTIFFNKIKTKDTNSSSLEDAAYVLSVIKKAYEKK